MQDEEATVLGYDEFVHRDDDPLAPLHLAPEHRVLADVPHDAGEEGVRPLHDLHGGVQKVTDGRTSVVGYEDVVA